MKTMKILFMFWMTVAGCLSATLYSQNPASSADESHHAPPPARRSAQHEALRQEIHSELRHWAQKEVVPQLREWKSQLDASMDNADLKTLNDLRSKAAALRAEQREAVERGRLAWMEFDEATIDELASHHQKLRQQHMQLVQELRPLAEKYKSTLEKISLAAKPTIQIWVSTIQSKIQDFEQRHGVSTLRIRPEWTGHLLHMFAAAPRSMRMRAVSTFMLWDGADIPEFRDQPSVLQLAPVQKTDLSSTFTLGQNVPNPVIGSSTTLSFSLRQADHVKISLVDIKGSEIAVITDMDYTAGDHFVDFPVGSIANGQYVYRMVCSQGSLSNTLTIAR